MVIEIENGAFQSQHFANVFFRSVRIDLMDFMREGDRNFWKSHPKLTLQLLEGIFVVSDVVDIERSQAALAQAIEKGLLRYRGIVFNSGKSLFLSGGHQDPVFNETSRGVVKMTGYA
jgi:hypothetical protein